MLGLLPQASPAVTVPWGLVQQAQGGRRKACSREHSRRGADISHKERSEPGDKGEAKERGRRRLVTQPCPIILGGEGRPGGEEETGVGESWRGAVRPRVRVRGAPRPSPRVSVGLCTDLRPARLKPRRAVCELGASSEHKQASVYFGNRGRRPRGQGKRTPCRGSSARRLYTHSRCKDSAKSLAQGHLASRFQGPQEPACKDC